MRISLIIIITFSTLVDEGSEAFLEMEGWDDTG